MGLQNQCAFRGLGFRQVWELEKHKNGSPSLLIPPSPGLKQSHSFQTMAGVQSEV